jgi:hypothetical protein
VKAFAAEARLVVEKIEKIETPTQARREERQAIK